MKIEAKVKTLKDIIESIKSSRIKLPKFQRDFAWGKDKIIKLLKSLEIGSPIGVITLYNSHDGCEILIDGQQRISSIKKIINKPGEYGVEDIEKIYDYEIPIIYWKKREDQEISLAKWFQDIKMWVGIFDSIFGHQ